MDFSDYPKRSGSSFMSDPVTETFKNYLKQKSWKATMTETLNWSVLLSFERHKSEKSKAKLSSTFINTWIKDICCYGWNFFPQLFNSSRTWWHMMIDNSLACSSFGIQCQHLYLPSNSNIKMHTGRLTVIDNVKQDPRRTHSTLKAHPDSTDTF